MGRLAKVKKSKGLRGQRFTKEQKDKALDLLSSGMGPSKVAKVIGTTTQSLALERRGLLRDPADARDPVENDPMTSCGQLSLRIGKLGRVDEPSSSTPRAATKPGEEPRFSCEAQMAIPGEEFVGEASLEGDRELGDEAREKACRKLREARGVDCDDMELVRTVQSSRSVVINNGKKSQSHRVVLRMMRPLRGDATSLLSAEDACKRAVEQVCRQRPGAGSCDLSGFDCRAPLDMPARWRCSRKKDGAPAPQDPFGGGKRSP